MIQSATGRSPHHVFLADASPTAAWGRPRNFAKLLDPIPAKVSDRITSSPLPTYRLMYYTKDLVDALAATLDLPVSRVRNEILPATINTIIQMAQDEGLTLTGFGIFNRWDRPARRGRNPKTGADVQVPPTSTLRFRPSKTLLKYPIVDQVTGRTVRLIDDPEDVLEALANQSNAERGLDK